MPAVTASIIILGILIFILVVVAKQFLLSMGLEANDFISFLKADQKIDKIYKLAKKYNSLKTSEKIMFLDESKEIFDAFSKVPDRLWDNEYNKYMEILDTYQNAKIDKWKNHVGDIPSINSYKDKRIKRDLRKIALKGNSIKTKKVEDNI